MSCATVGSGTAVSTPPLPWTRRSPRPGATSPTSRATISERRSAPKHMSATRGFSRGSVHCCNTDSTVSHRGTRGSRALRRGRVNTSTGFRPILSPHRPLAQAAQRGQPYADAAGLQPPRRQVILVRPTGLSREMGHQHGSSEWLHHERLIVPEAPAVRLDGSWGRLLLDPEIVAELLEQGGQAHRLPPRVRHALEGSIGGYEPCVNVRGTPRGRRSDRDPS